MCLRKPEDVFEAGCHPRAADGAPFFVLHEWVAGSLGLSEHEVPMGREASNRNLHPIFSQFSSAGAFRAHFCWSVPCSLRSKIDLGHRACHKNRLRRSIDVGSFRQSIWDKNCMRFSGSWFMYRRHQCTCFEVHLSPQSCDGFVSIPLARCLPKCPWRHSPVATRCNHSRGNACQVFAEYRVEV